MNAVDFTEHAVTKGARLHDMGRVTLRGDREAFVEGDHGVYLVRAFTGGGLTCTCPSIGGKCSHIVAALLAWGEALASACEPDQASHQWGEAEEGAHVSDSH